MASMGAVRRSLRQVATIAARRGASAGLVAEAGASRAILAGELRAQVRIKVNTLERGKILRPGCAEAPAIGEGGGTERRARGLDPTAMPS